jgi:hypothetical protein
VSDELEKFLAAWAWAQGHTGACLEASIDEVSLNNNNNGSRNSGNSE